MKVYITFGDLASWLSIAPVKKLVEEVGLVLEWQPMLSSLGNVVSTNLNPGEEDPLAAYKARRAKARSKAAVRERGRMCEMLAISDAQGQREIDPLNLSLGLMWLDKQNAEVDQYFLFIERAFSMTFEQQADVESMDAVKRLIDEIGMATDGFADFVMDNSRTLNASQDEFLESGILNAPAFVIDGEIFHGREHLPLMTWMLTGKQGDPPV